MILLAGVAGLGQRPTAGDFVIRSSTNLVEVRVVATDSKGHPITDLRREDFQVLDNSKPQVLRLFASASPAASGAGGPGDATPTEPRYAFVLLDWLNTAYPFRLAAQANLLHLLRTYQPKQKLGIYVLSAHPHMLVDFTADRDILTALVEHMDMENRPPGMELRPLSREEQVKLTIRTLTMMGEHLQHVPGRKSVVLVSEGFLMGVRLSAPPAGKTPPLPPTLFFQDIEKALAKLNAADVAIYSIDPGGLRILPSFTFETLREISPRTGGTAFYDRNDLDVGMRMALEDPLSSYTLGFHAPDSPKRGLHAIEVKVLRAGVKLRYRETYDPSASRR
jgi:VWFA-related protein